MNTGAIDINITVEAKKIVAVDINSTRPYIAKLFIGMTCEQVISIISSLYTICKNSHLLAASYSLYSLPNQPQNIILAKIERAGEHLWRLFLDWQTAIGEPALNEPYKNIYKVLNNKNINSDDKYSHCQKELCDYFGDVNILKNINTVAELTEQIKASNTPFYNLLQKIISLEKNSKLAVTYSNVNSLTSNKFNIFALENKTKIFSDKFNQLPNINDKVLYTNIIDSFSNHKIIADLQKTNFILANIFARALDVINIFENTSIADKLSNQNNIGCALTSRGLLTHIAEVENNKIINYAIFAPTEWNFQIGDILNQLIGLEINNKNKQMINATILAFDPCVPYNINYSEQ